MQMKNWNVGMRIAAGFAAVIAIATALGLFAYSKTGGIERDSTEAVVRALPKVYMAGQLQKNVQAVFSLALQHAASQDKQEKAQLDAEIQALRAANTGLVSEFEKLVLTERGRALLDALRTAGA